MLYILSKGLVMLNKKVGAHGEVWGEDFVLSDRNLIRPIAGTALTYIEVYFLTREGLMDVIERSRSTCPQLEKPPGRRCRALLKVEDRAALLRAPGGVPWHCGGGSAQGHGDAEEEGGGAERGAVVRLGLRQVLGSSRDVGSHVADHDAAGRGPRQGGYGLQDGGHVVQAARACLKG